MKHFIRMIVTKVNYRRVRLILTASRPENEEWFNSVERKSFASQYGKAATVVFMTIAYGVFVFISRGLELVEKTSWDFMINRVFSGDALTEVIAGAIFIVAFAIGAVFLVALLLETPIEDISHKELVNFNEAIKSIGYIVVKNTRKNQLYILKQN